MTGPATELVRRYFEQVFNEQRVEAPDEFVATRYIEHALAPFGDSEPGEVDGPEHTRSVVGWLREQFPDIQMTVEFGIAEGDLVAVLVRSEGTNHGPLNSVIPPTGRRFRARQSHWYRIDGGKLVEHWAVRDDLTTMLQLGVVTRPGPPASL
jgi:predicted ester cyclase